MKMSFEQRIVELKNFGYPIYLNGNEFVFVENDGSETRTIIDNKLKNEIKKWHEYAVENGAYEKVAEEVVKKAIKKIEEEDKLKEQERNESTMQNQTKVRNVKSLMRDMKKGMFDMNHPVQRKAEQWNKAAKELLFDSINKNIVILPIVFAVKDDVTFVVDGKQRLGILDEFINRKDTKLRFNGVKFDDLDEDTKDKILSAEITTITYTNCTDEEIFELFERYNNGVSLSGSQKSRSYANIEILAELQKVLTHPFMLKCNITEGQKKKSEDETTILQAAMLISDFSFKDFSFKEINRYLQEVETQDIIKTLQVIYQKMDILDNFIEEKQKNLKKIALPMVLATVENNETYKGNLLNFLENYKEQEEFKKYAQGSTSQKAMVMGRWEVFKKMN